MKIGFSNPLLAISHQRFRLPNLALALKWVLCLIFVSCFTNVTIAQPKRPPSTAQIEDPNKQIAHILFEQNEFAKATILLEDIVNADPSDELSYNRYMICLVKLGEQDKAIKWIKKRIKKVYFKPPKKYWAKSLKSQTSWPCSTWKLAIAKKDLKNIRT
jgi:tetratricopeptide (TPR) repeat protein